MGVRSSWLTLATKSWRTRSSRLRSVTSWNTAALPGRARPSGDDVHLQRLAAGGVHRHLHREVTPSRQARSTASWSSVRRTRNSGRWPTSSCSVPSMLRSASLWRSTTPVGVGDPHALLHALDGRAERLDLEQRLVTLLGHPACPRIGRRLALRRSAAHVALGGQGAGEAHRRGRSGPPATRQSAHRPSRPAAIPAPRAGRRVPRMQKDDSAGFGSVGHASLSGLASL